VLPRNLLSSGSCEKSALLHMSPCTKRRLIVRAPKARAENFLGHSMHKFDKRHLIGLAGPNTIHGTGIFTTDDLLYIANCPLSLHCLSVHVVCPSPSEFINVMSRALKEWTKNLSLTDKIATKTPNLHDRTSRSFHKADNPEKPAQATPSRKRAFCAPSHSK